MIIIVCNRPEAKGAYEENPFTGADPGGGTRRAPPPYIGRPKIAKGFWEAKIVVKKQNI